VSSHLSYLFQTVTNIHAYKETERTRDINCSIWSHASHIRAAGHPHGRAARLLQKLPQELHPAKVFGAKAHPHLALQVHLPPQRRQQRPVCTLQLQHFPDPNHDQQVRHHSGLKLQSTTEGDTALPAFLFSSSHATTYFLFL